MDAVGEKKATDFQVGERVVAHWNNRHLPGVVVETSEQTVKVRRDDNDELLTMHPYNVDSDEEGS